MTARPSSSIRFECPSCGGRVKVPPGQAGQKCQCPKCGAAIVAPDRPDQPAGQSDQTVEDDFFAADFFAQPAPAPIAAPSPPPAQPQSLGTAQSQQKTEPPPAPKGPSPPPAATKASPRPPRKSSPATARTERFEFGVECWLCGTRLHATLDQVGKELKCPDCHSLVPVKAPSKLPPAQRRESEDRDEFPLSEPVQRPRTEYLPQETLAPQATESPAGAKPAREERPRSSPTGDAAADTARQVMAKAEADVEAEERARPKLPEQPFRTGILAFLFDAAGILRWVVLTFMGHGLVASLCGAFALAQGGPVQQFGAVFLSVVVIALGVAFALFSSACGLAIVEDTANGFDKIERWPGTNVSEWMFESFYVINSLLASAAPGALFMSLLSTGATAVCAGILTGIAFFPIFLLSALEQASPLGFASPAIWNTLTTEQSRWLKFYLLSAGLAALGVAAGSLMATRSFLLWGLSSAVLTATALVYFRLLGRLTWCLAERNAPGTTKHAGKNSNGH